LLAFKPHGVSRISGGSPGSWDQAADAYGGYAGSGSWARFWLRGSGSWTRFWLRRSRLW